MARVFDPKKLVKDVYGKAGAHDRVSGGRAETVAVEVGYDPNETSGVPEEANLGLGCGNPTALSELKPGEIVLDLGSGAGLDCFLAAKAVGPAGRVIGVDMTPEMIARASASASRHGYSNAEFRQGDIESLPVEGNSVDVVLSNCVINLVPNKAKVFREIERVLRPGGRMVVSDLVLMAPLPDAVRQSETHYACCISGAIRREDYLRMIHSAGLENVEVVTERDASGMFVDPTDPARNQLIAGVPVDDIRGWVSSVTLRAEKPRGPRSRPKDLADMVVLLGHSDELIAEANGLGLDVAVVGPPRTCCSAGGGAYETFAADPGDSEEARGIVQRLGETRRIRGVLSGQGYFLSTAAECASGLGLEHALSPRAAECGQDKWRARQRLQEAGLAGPRAEVASTPSEAVGKAEAIGLPVVVKPLNDSNSRLVRLCRGPEDVRKAAESILGTKTNLVGQPLAPLALIEEYIDGPEYSMEIVVHRGSAHVVAVCEKTVGPPPFFVEVGHAVPATLGAALDEQMRSVAEVAVKALGISSLVVHMEVRVRGGQVFIIETNFRPAGGRMATLISTVTGWNLNRVAIRLAVGDAPGAPGESIAKAGIYQCLTANVPSTVHYEKVALRVDSRHRPFVELDAEPGSTAYPVNDPRGRVIGRILAYADSVPQAWSEARKIRSSLKFRTEPLEEQFDESGPSSGCWEAGCC